MDVRLAQTMANGCAKFSRLSSKYAIIMTVKEENIDYMTRLKKDLSSIELPYAYEYMNMNSARASGKGMMYCPPSGTLPLLVPASTYHRYFCIDAPQFLLCILSF